MQFQELTLPEVWLIKPDPATDERGWFARTFCTAEFSAHGLPSAFDQCSISFNVARGTLRGMHWQAAPHGEGKLVRCTRGAIYDVAVDVRPGSSTYGHWVAETLDHRGCAALFIPGGFAHGFQTLEDASEVFYQMTTQYHPEASRGFRWNDPKVGIAWPIARPILSVRDAAMSPLA